MAQLREILDKAEEHVANPTKHFGSFQEYLDSVHTDQEQNKYKAKVVENKRRSARDRAMRKGTGFDD